MSDPEGQEFESAGGLEGARSRGELRVPSLASHLRSLSYPSFFDVETMVVNGSRKSWIVWAQVPQIDRIGFSL